MRKKQNNSFKKCCIKIFFFFFFLQSTSKPSRWTSCTLLLPWCRKIWIKTWIKKKKKTNISFVYKFLFRIDNNYIALTFILLSVYLIIVARVVCSRGSAGENAALPCVTSFLHCFPSSNDNIEHTWRDGPNLR